MEKHTGFASRLSAWLLQKGSDHYNQQVDSRKRKLLSNLSGRVLEIGPGTGANIPYYPDDISLVGLEPSPHMQAYLKENVEEAHQHMEIITGAAESVHLAEASMDTVVSTLVLCSVDRIDKALSEIKRVLKPGGHFLFIEHVAAPQQSSLRRIQRWINPLWKRVADGCHTDRETWKAIKKAGFDHVD